MRTLILSYLTPLVTPGGAQQVAYEEFTALREEGHEAFMIAAMEADHEDIFGKPGAPIVPMQGEKNQYFYFPQQYYFELLAVGDPRSLHFLGDLIKRIAPEVVHIHHYHRFGLEAIRVARLAAPNAVICMTFHEMMAICLADGQMVKRGSRHLCKSANSIHCNECFPNRRPEFFSLRAERAKTYLADCDVFIFPSIFLAERYVKWGLPDEKCVVIANGQLDRSERFDVRQHSPKVNRFGFFGQMIDNKGVDVVFDAILSLAREDRVPPAGIVFEINGGNRHYASEDYIRKLTDAHIQIKEYIGTRNISVVDRGAYTHAQLGERMGSVDWVIAPSTWWEVFGLVLTEAWMFGRVPIVSDIAGLGERVNHRENGLKFPVRNSAELAKLMTEASGNVALWKKLSANAPAAFDHLAMLKLHLELFEEIRASRKGAAAEKMLAAPKANRG